MLRAFTAVKKPQPRLRWVLQIQQHWPQRALYLGAQAHLRDFYGHFGFISVTDVYDEDGIPHVGMAREVAQA